MVRQDNLLRAFSRSCVPFLCVSSFLPARSPNLSSFLLPVIVVILLLLIGKGSILAYERLSSVVWARVGSFPSVGWTLGVLSSLLGFGWDKQSPMDRKSKLRAVRLLAAARPMRARARYSAKQGPQHAPVTGPRQPPSCHTLGRPDEQIAAFLCRSFAWRRSIGGVDIDGKDQRQTCWRRELFQTCSSETWTCFSRSMRKRLSLVGC